MSTTRFTDAAAALLTAYTSAAGLAGVPVYDGPQPSASYDPDFIIVGHDATMGPDGNLQSTVLTGNYLQEWSDTTTGMDERGWIQCVAVSQTGDSGDVAGRRARVKVLLAAAEDAAAAAVVSHLTFDGTSDGRFIARQSSAGVAVVCAYRVAYSAPWS
jgi:hypothetical protein